MRAVEKYDERARAAETLLCVGLDSDISKLPPRFRTQAAPQFEFNRHIIDLTAQYAAAFKFNIAFYEANGADGLRQLEQSIVYLRQRHPQILTVCDAKRADIGNTSAAYAHAIFEQLGFDALTLNPYLGRDALQPFLDYDDRACIILCRTSNPGSAEFQNLPAPTRPLWQVIAERVADDWNDKGNCMLVVSATSVAEMATIRSLTGDMTLLAPGIGVQGGNPEAVIRAGINSAGRGLIINSSRGIIFASDPAATAADLRDSLNRCRRKATENPHAN